MNRRQDLGLHPPLSFLHPGEVLLPLQQKTAIFDCNIRSWTYRRLVICSHLEYYQPTYISLHHNRRRQSHNFQIPGYMPVEVGRGFLLLRNRECAPNRSHQENLHDFLLHHQLLLRCHPEDNAGPRRNYNHHKLV